MKFTRNAKVAIAAAAFAAAGALPFVMVGVANADPVAIGDGGEIAFIADQEDVTTDGTGKVRLCFNNLPVPEPGEAVEDGVNNLVEPELIADAPGTEVCPEATTPFAESYHTQSVNVQGVRNLKADGNFPVSFQTAHHTDDGTVLTILDRNGNPLQGDIRITYTAVATRPTPEPAS